MTAPTKRRTPLKTVLSRSSALEALEVQARDSGRLLENPMSQWRLSLRRFRERKSGRVGLFIIGALILVAIFAPLIAPYDPTAILTGKEDVTRRSPPCIHMLGCPEGQLQHILGTDGVNHDEFSRIIYGSRVSLSLGFFTVTLALTVGSAVGAIAGYIGGWIDNVLMRIMDV
ncbi:MAG TPA: ABC transporter permease, partial [Acidimicrobiia bacterium]|nr:ABC transporter permease [Acidimicrobiia bacterium]